MSLKINLGVSKFILKMGNPSARQVYEFGDFRLDAGHRMLYQKDEELALAPKAVETLVALVERRGEIMSKDELLEAVWPDAVVEESNLFVYLSVLRKTLGTQENGNPWVETLRRRGYRFSGEVRFVPTRNGGDGSSSIQPAPLRLVPTTPTVDAPESESAETLPTPNTRTSTRRMVFLAIGFAAVLASVALAYQYFIHRPINSLAVMPFVNETQDPDLEHVLDGLTDNFITSLSKMEELNVQSWTSVRSYKGKETDPRAIGTELDVDAVVYGRVKKRGEDLELHVELVDAQSGARLWQETGIQKTAQLVVLARKVEQGLLAELKSKRSGSTEREITSTYPTNTEAYSLYLKGRFYALKLTKPEIYEGITLLYQAIEKDPTYAKAYAGIARAHLFLGIAGEAHPSEFLKAKDAAEKAIALDDTSAEGYSALAAVAFFYDWNFTDAERLYKRALELDPKSSTVHQQYADLLTKTGRNEEGRTEIERAREWDPNSPWINAAYALCLPDTEALEQIRFAIDLNPDIYVVRLFAGEIYRRNKMYNESVAALRRANELAPQQTWSDVALIGALKEVGKLDEARMLADKMSSDYETRYVPPSQIALAYLQLGDEDKAFTYFEKALEVHDPKMVFLNERQWSDYSDNPRFQDVKRRVGFAQ